MGAGPAPLLMTKNLIGLTGGIATGKSTVANYLATTYNLPILDADIYARDAVSVGSPILSQIAEKYGTEILLKGEKFSNITSSLKTVKCRFT